MRAISLALCERCGGNRVVPDEYGRLYPYPECCCPDCELPTPGGGQCFSCALDEDRERRWRR